MIVEVMIVDSDLCNNIDYNHHGFYEVNSIEEAQAIFPSNTFLIRFEVQPIDIKPLPTSQQSAGDAYRARRFRR